MKHVLSSDQYTRKSLEEVFRLAEKIRNNPNEYAHKLDDKIIAINAILAKLTDEQLDFIHGVITNLKQNI